ncbi:MAG: VOC family protein [Firmicutes bacterium]|nr:VOC family protein [Bacillota bacterium]
MRIEHAAMYVIDLETMRDFFCRYFGAVSGELYYNEKKGFRSYFLTFDGGARLELMHQEGCGSPRRKEDAEGASCGLGLHHLAMGVGSREAVDELSRRLEEDGYRVVGQPRTTGDGYYESVVLDPEHNRIEITV